MEFLDKIVDYLRHHRLIESVIHIDYMTYPAIAEAMEDYINESMVYHGVSDYYIKENKMLFIYRGIKFYFIRQELK